MARQHHYEITTTWVGDRGRGTADYRAYDRDHISTSPRRPAIEASSDPAFRGDPTRWNPELLLVAALSQCHMLQYLHRCAIGGVVVTAYSDDATGTMVEDKDDGGALRGGRPAPGRRRGRRRHGRARRAVARGGVTAMLHRVVGQLPCRPRAEDRRGHSSQHTPGMKGRAAGAPQGASQPFAPHPIEVAGVRLPGSEAARAAEQLCHQASSRMLYAHAVRS
jgi:organic hydroperoxide reductase OsmC/OhrA